MANWNNPTVASAYTDVPIELKDRDIDTATWFEGSTSTNIPINTKRYNPSSNTFETWDGASWNQLDLSLASFISGVGNNQVLYTNGSGVVTGSSGLTFDGSNLVVSGNLTVDTNTLFVDAANNRVGIGTAAPQALLHAVSNVNHTVIGSFLVRNTSDGLDGMSLYYTGDKDDQYAAVFGSTGVNSTFYFGSQTAIVGSVKNIPISFLVNNDAKAFLLSTGNFGIGTSAPLGKFDSRSTSDAQLVASYDAFNYMVSVTNSTGATAITAVGSDPYFRWQLGSSTVGTFYFNNTNINAFGSRAGFMTQGVARGFIGALRHGASADTIFTGEAADGFGIRAETVMQFGIGYTGVMQMTSAGLYIGGLSNPVGKLTISGGHTVQIGNNYGFLAMGAGNDFSNYEGVLVAHQGGVSSKFISLGEGTGTPRPFYWSTWNGSSGIDLMSLQTDGSLTVGFIGTPSARIHAVATTEQLRLGYDGSNYASHTVDASGNYTIAPSGSLFTVTLSSRSLILSSPTAGSLLLNSGSASMTGSFNTALGISTLTANTTGYSNTALGLSTLTANTTGYYNTALGHFALAANTAGYYNTALGPYALAANTTGIENTAMGGGALNANTNGIENTAVGYASLSNNTGSSNTAVGHAALSNNTTGTNNTAIGYNAQSTTASASNEITLGDANVTALRCNVTTISSLSDKRDKSKIKEIQNALDFINDLMPVSFEWKRRDGSMQGVKDSGFIAQDLDEVQKKHNIDYLLNLVYKSNPEKLEASYGKLLPMIVKAVQELNAKVDALADQ